MTQRGEEADGSHKSARRRVLVTGACKLPGAICQAHDIDNLYVVDSSFFVSSVAVNPTLTIVANALRVAEHLRGRLGA